MTTKKNENVVDVHDYTPEKAYELTYGYINGFSGKLYANYVEEKQNKEKTVRFPDIDFLKHWNVGDLIVFLDHDNGEFEIKRFVRDHDIHEK